MKRSVLLLFSRRFSVGAKRTLPGVLFAFCLSACGPAPSEIAEAQSARDAEARRARMNAYFDEKAKERERAKEQAPEAAPEPLPQAGGTTARFDERPNEELRARALEKERREWDERKKKDDAARALETEARVHCRWVNVPAYKPEWLEGSSPPVYSMRHGGFLTSKPICDASTRPEVLDAARRIAIELTRSDDGR